MESDIVCISYIYYICNIIYTIKPFLHGVYNVKGEVDNTHTDTCNLLTNNFNNYQDKVILIQVQSKGFQHGSVRSSLIW